MNLGQKIKTLRTEKMMTQKELAGSEITRNMLSQIENGGAMPSLSTIIYLAKKLGVPAGYLLSEGDEEFLYIKTNAIKNIRRAYIDKSFELCREICLSSFNEFDDELELILTDSCLGYAEECILNGKLYRACHLLDEALSHADKTMYSTQLQKNKVLVAFGFLKQLSPTLDSYEADTDELDSILNPDIYDNVFTKYLTVLLREDTPYSTDVIADLSNVSTEYDNLLVSHLKVRENMKSGKYDMAKEQLLHIIDGAITPPRLLLYMCCCDMEICCKEGNDYKGAYEFSNNKLEILEHMLIDD